MAAEEENNKKNEGKGFAGLSSLVSDVDTTPPPPAPKTESAGSTTSTGRPAAQTAQPQPQQPTQRQTYQEPPQPSSGSSGGKWLLGIAAVVGLLWLIGQSNKPTSSPATAYSPPAQSAAPSYSPPAQPQAPSVPQESKPPVGQDLVFSMAQIRYCLAEDIRIEGAKAALNNYSDSDVDRFNAMVADYNSRCSSFKYQTNNRGRNDLNSAQRDIEPYRSQLQAEGRRRFTRRPSTGSLSAPAQARPAADETVRAVQQKLNELGYSAGLADGLMGRGTRAAIIAFQQDRGLAATGAADQALLLQLQQAPSRSSRPQPDSRPATTSVQLSAAESASLEAACSTDKYVNGPAAYRACVERQKAALAAGVRRPNLSALSSAEQQSIEAACSTDKYVNGPAAYNECLANQLAAMSGQGARRPDLSRLSSSERQSIEAACSTDKYVNGPAAYNRCLNNQLVALERQGGRPDLSRLSTTERNSIEAACSTDKYVNGPAAYNRCLSQQLARLRN
ncbi:peptidoglycan-binding protein [Aeromonas hydrophila]|uniref:Peptidoglycan-binding domain-containing protein n=2 Tax=Aeromonas TaxID=642 RepID=A0AAX3P903_AERHY|nr:MULTISPECIES: peptidoglycan-binding domain-containing protein [Aeromonas]MBJ7588936.1 peptidoglycan-binding protein [Aeromonas veronii]MBS4705867.1 peptidoglycan-binding protein [Aeromonas veronii]WEE27458.1 peptidoglycan-binding domain-containing protein [Aeromonas hydrophila]